MIYELVYTSAPITFDGPGYGVVARTREISAAVERHMLKLCRFDFLPTGKSEISEPIPEMISHTVMLESNQKWHVFSRTAYAGLDYTHRSVFIAHHVALTDETLGRLSPFDLIQSPRMFRTEWKEGTAVLPQRELSSLTAPLPAPGRWSQLFGSEKGLRYWLHLQEQQSHPVFLISKDSRENLRLLCEAGQSLDPTEARDLSFISALGADQKGVRFDWIGLVHGTTLAQSVMKASSVKVVDTSRPGLVNNFVEPAAAVRSDEHADHAAVYATRPATVEFKAPSREPVDTYDACWQEAFETLPQPAKKTASVALPPVPPSAGPRPLILWGTLAALGVLICGGLATLMVGSRPRTSETSPREAAVNGDPQPFVARNDDPPTARPLASQSTVNGGNSTGSQTPPAMSPPDRTLPAGIAAASTQQPAQGTTGVAQTPGTGTKTSSPQPGPPAATNATPGSAAPRRGQFFLKQGLLEITVPSEDQWVSLAQLPAGPNLSSLTLLGATPLGLASERTQEGELKIFSSENREPAISIRCAPRVNLVEIRIPSIKLSRRIIERLRFCSLKLMDFGQQDFDGYQLSFNPLQPALSSRAETLNLSDDLTEFYLTAVTTLPRDVTLVCHIESVSFLPQITEGVSVQVSRTVIPGRTLEFPLTLTVRESPLHFLLPVKSFFNRDTDGSQPPLTLLPIYEGQVSAQETSAADIPAVTPPDAQASVPVADAVPPVRGNRTTPKPGNTAPSPQSARPGRNSDKRPAAQNETPASRIKEKPAEELSSYQDAELLTEVFSRFGTATGSLIIRTEQDGRPLEYPVIKFESRHPAKVAP